MTRDPSTKTGASEPAFAHSALSNERSAPAALRMPPELTVQISGGGVEAIAELVNAYPQLQDPVFATVQHLRGNAFAHAVVLALTALQKQPANRAPEPAPEPSHGPARSVEDHPGASPQSEPQKVQDRRRTAGWEQIARGGINDARHAPSEIRLPASVVSAIEHAWQDSLAHHPEREEGGNLVRTYGGSYRLRRAEGHADDAFEPDPSDIAWTETMVGTVHTHPYRDEHERNPAAMPTDYGTVSAPDLDSIVNRDGPLFVVRSGPYTYVIAKSKQFNELVQRHEAQGTLNELVLEMETLSDQIYEAAKGNISQKLEEAIIAVCSAYHLVYYEGQGSDLKRVGGPR